MNNWLVITASIAYLLLLFGVAYFAEYQSKKGKSIVKNAYIYALSLAVYCTAWTFFGSVGKAADSGIEFLFIYLGPTLMAPLFWIILRKIIRISKVQRITSIADFISTRYGKNISLGIIVTILCVIGVIPYIAIQIKAVSSSIHLLTGTTSSPFPYSLFSDSGLYLSIGLAVFVILFGTRNVDATEKHEGLVAAIAFESIIKLMAFIAAGLFVTYGLFNGFADIMQKAASLPKLKELMVIPDGNKYLQLFASLFLSMLVVLLLPRQFQVAVVENTHEQHVKKAMWLFPLYLFIINIFVIPIAFGGAIIFQGKAINADTYVLSLPINAGANWLSLLVYIGGFSAASSMIIVETIALSTMMSNNIVMPLLLSANVFTEKINRNISRFIINSRRFSIIGILFLAYLYDKLVAEKFSLVSIGMVSFVAIAQFTPAVIGGIYWKRGNKNAALTGIVVGFCIWFFTLIVPSLVDAGIITKPLTQQGLWGFSMLKPTALFGLEGVDSITHSFFWSIFLNTLCYVGISLFTERKSQELYQSELFVDIYKHYATAGEGTIMWKGTAYIPDLKTLLANFIGEKRSTYLLESYARKHQINLNSKEKAEPGLVNFAERVLAGTIGSASARIMVKTVVKEEELGIDEVLKMLRESQHMKETNKELRKKSQELHFATEELRKANQQLKEIDEMKDEFLYTVTHELRTPLTSIRALSEIVYDNPDMEPAEKQHYLEAVIKETERLSHLITQVLNLERYESGKAKLHYSDVDIAELIYENTESIKPLVVSKNIQFHHQLQSFMPPFHGDSDLISQVFYNLISNAAKYAVAQISISASFQDELFTIKVADDGKGIPAEVHELIFDKFFQAKNQTLKKPQGSGLGLAICKNIVEMHKGKIWVESTENEGATFFVTLPQLNIHQ